MNSEGQSKWPKRWIISWVLFIIVALLVAVSGFFTWSRLNCWEDEIDINSGRTRYTRYFLHCRVAESISSTQVSEVLLPGDFDAGKPDWRRVNTFSPGVHHSPHYVFHSAIHQSHTLASFWELADFTQAARRQSVLALTAAWKRGNSDDEANDYLDALSKVVFHRADSKSRVPVDDSDIPIAGTVRAKLR